MNKRLGCGVLTGNQLKIIAAIFMTADHLGLMVFPSVAFLRIIGRLAFPIFAYMIAEGFSYTKSRKKYLLKMVVFGAAFQVVYFAAARSLYQGVFVTFSLSVVLCFAADNVLKKGLIKSLLLFGLQAALVFFVTEMLPQVLSGTDFCVDYGFFGVMLPVAVFMARKKRDKLICFFSVLILLSASFGGIQWWCLFSVPLIALYNGERGRIKMKNFFYLYYPLHLAVLYIVQELVSK